MKHIKTNYYTLLSLIFAVLSIAGHILAAPSSIGCTIQYSKNSTLTLLNVVCAGVQLIVTLHENSLPKITFEIPKSSDQWHFDLLITAATIDYQLKQLPEQENLQNTIDHLKIDPHASYKYYSLDFIEEVWEITEKNLPESGQIADKTIIIECYPEWVQNIKGGSRVELPTIYLNNALTDLGFTEEDFKEALVKLEITALDSKTIHSQIRRKTQTISDKKRVLIMDLLV